LKRSVDWDSDEDPTFFLDTYDKLSNLLDKYGPDDWVLQLDDSPTENSTEETLLIISNLSKMYEILEQNAPEQLKNL
jgi:hypothetical protein